MSAKTKASVRPPEARATDEKSWWRSKDEVEPFMGVPAVTGGVMPAPLPDDRPFEPEPGVEHEQEDGEREPLFEVPEQERLDS